MDTPELRRFSIDIPDREVVNIDRALALRMAGWGQVMERTCFGSVVSDRFIHRIEGEATSEVITAFMAWARGELSHELLTALGAP